MIDYNKIIVDTRNQKDDFVVKSLQSLGYEVERDTLNFGDVAFDGARHIVVDLKSSGGGLIELARNRCSKDHDRMKREIEKCIKYNGEITFLCFEPNINCIEDIKNWQIPKFKSTAYITRYYEQNTNKPLTKALITKNPNIKYYTKREVRHRIGEPMTKVKPETLMKSLMTMCEQDHYAKGKKVNLLFTNKEDCGRKIIEILTHSQNQPNNT